MNMYNRRQFLSTAAAFLLAAPEPRVTTVVGTGKRGVAADGDEASHANIDNPFFTLFGPDGLLYFSDYGSNRVLRVDKRNRISVVAGNGTRGYSGDGGPAR